MRLLFLPGPDDWELGSHCYDLSALAHLKIKLEDS